MHRLTQIIGALGLATATIAQPAVAEDGVGAEYMVMETSANEAAERDFLVGLALLHSFEYNRAATAFQRAQAADPGFVMAYWGEAMTHNHPLWDEQDRDAALAALAKLGATPAERAAKARSPREAQWLDAVETLYGEGSKKDRDLAYLARMEALFASNPSDIDARAFTGLAILGSSHGGRQVPLYMRAAGLLEPGFMTHEMHPGILHYLIHSYDDPVHAPLGERAAACYAKVAPNAGHAQHMVSHIFHALGDWEASEAANINADAVVDRQRIAAGREPNFCGHYNEWLVYAKLQLGEDAGAIVNGCRKQAERHIAGEARGKLGWGPASSYGAISVWQGVATGEWPEPLAGTGDAFLFVRYDLANAKLLANFGNEEVVEEALAEMRSLSAQIDKALTKEAPLNSYTRPWMERQIAQGEAILELSHGRVEEGLALLRSAAEAESALPVVFGPPAMAKPSWELLGEQLLAMGHRAKAKEAFEQSLAFAPGRYLSLRGLEAAR